MKDELVSYDTAVLAKEKGFDIVTKMNPSYYPWQNINGFYKVEDKYGYTVVQRFIKDGDAIWLAPTQSLLQRWLREKHRLEINISKDSYDIYHCMVVGDIEIKGPFYDHVYEKALEQGLQEALKLIKG